MKIVKKIQAKIWLAKLFVNSFILILHFTTKLLLLTSNFLQFKTYFTI